MLIYDKLSIHIYEEIRVNVILYSWTITCNQSNEF